ncbi:MULTISPECIES: hypothetical protein [Flavobacterium]|nr:MULTISPECIES: hypothetical protein [Flavobacterium]
MKINFLVGNKGFQLFTTHCAYALRLLLFLSVDRKFQACGSKAAL